jgi:hypothetical protein
VITNSAVKKEGYCMAERESEVHENQKTTRDHLNELIQLVGVTMSSEERSALHTNEEQTYIDQIVVKALEEADQNPAVKAKLTETIRALYNADAKNGQALLHDSSRNGTVLIDERGEIVALRESKEDRIKSGEASGRAYVTSYKDMEVLTGPEKGQIFSPSERGIPAPRPLG